MIPKINKQHQISLNLINFINFEKMLTYNKRNYVIPHIKLACLLVYQDNYKDND